MFFRSMNCFIAKEIIAPLVLIATKCSDVIGDVIGSDKKGEEPLLTNPPILLNLFHLWNEPTRCQHPMPSTYLRDREARRGMGYEEQGRDCVEYVRPSSVSQKLMRRHFQ